MPERTTRGIDHVGITVADIDAATAFFVDGLGGEVVYQALGTDDPPATGDELESRHDLAPGTRVTAQRVIKIEDGPDVELFEMHAPEQAGPARSSDIGLTHLAFYVDDMEAAVERFERAGGVVLSAPMPVGFPQEAGEGNRYCYGKTPWGMSVEFLTLPGEMPYERETALRRWQRRG